jgi:hypothetical protein
VSVELVSAISTGLIGLLGAVAAILANRSKRRSENDRAARRFYRDLERKLNAALRHITTLELALSSRGHLVPDRPEILEPDDDDDGPTPAALGANVRA